MSPTAVTQVITTLKAAHDNLGLERSPDDDFFWEWRQDFPPLSDAENETLDLIRQRFRYHRDMGQVSEGVVNAIVVSRLLELAGFYDPPHYLRSEAPVTIERQHDGEILRGRLDFLVVDDRFWRLVVESKDTQFDVEVGIPQLLAYMMSSEADSGEHPLFGLVTNGTSFLLVKLQRYPQPVYDFSDLFSLLSRENPLRRVLQFLKAI